MSVISISSCLNGGNLLLLFQMAYSVEQPELDGEMLPLRTI